MEDSRMDYKEQVKKYLEYCKYRKELDWNTLKAYKIDLRQFFEFSQEDMPKKSKIEDYITELHKKYKKKTVKRKIASVKAYYNYLEEYEIIDDNPFRKIKVKFKETTVLPKIIPREEIEILLNYIHSCKRINNEKAYKYWLRDIAVGMEYQEALDVVRKNDILNTYDKIIKSGSGIFIFRYIYKV